MANTKSTITNNMANFTARYRAECSNDNYKGAWRSTVDQATMDAAAHRAQPGHAMHVIEIVVEQSFRMHFT